MKIYHGERQSLSGRQRVDVEVIELKGDKVEKSCYELEPKDSQKLYNHSPDGFNWGYSGSGPAQLALAMLLDLTGNEELSRVNYQQFKACFIANFSDRWFLTEPEIRTWLEKQEVPA